MAQRNHQKSISVLSFNTFGTPVLAPFITARYKKFAKELDKSDIDVLCFQEVATYYHFSLLKKFLKAYPHHAYQKFVLGPKGGLAIFSKLPLEDIHYNSFVSLGSWKMYTQILRNGLLSCKLKDLPVRIINTHLITDFEYKSMSTNQYYSFVRLQMEESGKCMKLLAKKNDAVVLVGDFNAAKNDAIYKDFLKDTRAIDIFAKEESPTYFHDRFQWKFMAGKSVRIDYIFLLDIYGRIQIQTTDHVFTEQVQLTSINKNYLSDHIGLLAKFNIRK